MIRLGLDPVALQRSEASRLLGTVEMTIVPDRPWFVLDGGFRFDGRPIAFGRRTSVQRRLRNVLGRRTADDRRHVLTVFSDADEEDVPLRNLVSGWTVFEADGRFHRGQLVVFRSDAAAMLAKLGDSFFIDVPVPMAAAWSGPAGTPKFGYDS